VSGTPSEGARDALVYLSLSENGFFVSIVQGVFANALSVNGNQTACVNR